MKHHRTVIRITKNPKKCSKGQQGLRMLCDPNKRAAYDQYGHAGVDPSMGGGGAGFGGQNFSDIFGDVFSVTSSAVVVVVSVAAPSVAATCVTPGTEPGRSRARTTSISACQRWSDYKPCDGSGAERLSANHLPDLRRYRSGPHAAGLLLGAADLPAAKTRARSLPIHAMLPRRRAC